MLRLCSELNFPCFVGSSCTTLCSPHMAFLFPNAGIQPQNSDSYPCLHPCCPRHPPQLLTESFTSLLECQFLWKPSPALQIKSDTTVISFQSSLHSPSLPLWGCWYLLAWLLYIGLPYSTLSPMGASPASRHSLWNLPPLVQWPGAQ